MCSPYWGCNAHMTGRTTEGVAADIEGNSCPSVCNSSAHRVCDAGYGGVACAWMPLCWQFAHCM